MPITSRLALALILILPNLAAAQQDAPATTTPSNPIELLRDAQGPWKGVLEYKDFSSEKRVTLPATLDADADPDANFATLRFTFTDPTRQLNALTVVSFDTAEQQIVSTDFPDQNVQRFDIIDMDVSGPGQWSFVLETNQMDNNRDATARISQQRSGDTLTITRRIRYDDQPGAEWFTRDQIRLQRPVSDSRALLGTWKVDLRPTPDSPPSYTTLLISRIEENRFEGSFYATPVDQARVNDDWGDLRIAFTTSDGSGPYNSAAVLRDGVLHGTTNSTGRDFLSVWTATRVDNEK